MYKHKYLRIIKRKLLLYDWMANKEKVCKANTQKSKYTCVKCACLNFYLDKTPGCCFVFQYLVIPMLNKKFFQLQLTYLYVDFDKFCFNTSPSKVRKQFSFNNIIRRGKKWFHISRQKRRNWPAVSLHILLPSILQKQHGTTAPFLLPRKRLQK